MSRIGKRAVTIPGGVTATVDGQTVSVKGPKGALDFTATDRVTVAMNDGGIKVEPVDDSKEARQLLKRFDAALNAREAAERLASMERTLAEAESIRREIEEGEAALSLSRLPESAITELEALEIEIAKLKAIAEAARPSVAVTYEPQAPAVSLDGKPLKDGEAHGYDGQAELAIPGIGLVTLRSSYRAGGDEQLQRSVESRHLLLASMSVDDLAAARKRQLDAQRQEGDLREKRTRLSLLAPDGVPKLRESVTAHRETAGDLLELKEDPAQVRAAHEAAEARQLAARQVWREVEPLQAGAAAAVVTAQTIFAGLDAERVQVEAMLGPEATRAERESGMAVRLGGLNGQLAGQQASVEQLRETAGDLASLEAALRRHRSVAEATEKEIGKLREEIAGLSAEIRTRSDEAVEEKWQESVEPHHQGRDRQALLL